ncbi:serine/threonine protein kinase [Cetobacterium sp. 2A]|uniref:serine/threonine protein kinase n=1 Tax=Cetobacterium sp. 2A TaxID=2754723 RepID=UPI00163D2AD3|nr:serine/threonine protein kinase [Cetobacterium sp. 2A]MBC2856717.1 serine/threonine protein kinase [Cetobacterium sp. 2A]
MIKLFLLFFTTVMINIYGSEYNYPFKNPYKATILGSSMLMTDGVPETVPTKKYKIKIPPFETPPSNLWYEQGYEFAVSAQKKKAPLIFILSGTGAKYDSTRTKLFQRILYGAGYHVITVSSAFSTNFITTVSSSKMPGMLLQDSLDVYRALENMYKTVQNDIEVSDFYLMGYSMGASHSAVVSYIDESVKTFNFKRVFMVNPAVNLSVSANILDDMLNKNIGDNKENIGILVDRVIYKALKKSNGSSVSLNEETLYKLFEKEHLSNKDMQALIGLAFRLISVDINYVTDLLNNTKVYVKEPVGKFTNMFPYFQIVNFASFNDYLTKLAFPYYRNIIGTSMTMEKLLATSDLEQFKFYLKNSKKIAVVTNVDDFILTENNRKFLKDTFGNRFLMYPKGGHCGNMFYSENVKVMLKFLEEGTLNENK